MSNSFRIFISSTWIDLQPEREAVEKALHRMQSTTFSGMEYFGSHPETPKEVSLKEVERSEVYIGIYAHRYGSGITEAEYRRAREQNIPCLIYIKDDNAPVVPTHIDREPDKLARLETFKREVKQNHTVSFFSSPDQLATQVVTDLHNLLGSIPSIQVEEGGLRSAKYQINITDSHGINIGDGIRVIQHFPSNELNSERQSDLSSSIKQTLDLIKEYENKRRLSDNSKEQQDTEREMADLRRLLQEYRAELDELVEKDQPTTINWPVGIPNERYYTLPTREQALASLLSVLGDQQGSPMVVITGLGGLGKTATGVELARRAIQQGLFAGLVGDSAKQEILQGGQVVQIKEAFLDFDSLMDSIARQLGRWEIPTLNAKEKAARLGMLLKEKHYLVMVDNLETAENANELVAQLRKLLNGSRAVVTSRKQVRFDFVRSLSLPGLEVEDSLLFLRTDAQQRGVQQIQDASEDKLRQIHQVTGGAPLALKLVVGQAGFLDLNLIINQLQQAGSNLYPYIFQESWQQLMTAAQYVLIYIGKTAVTHVSWEELAGVGIAGDEATLLEAISQLVALSLLDVVSVKSQMRYGIHQLTRQFVTSDLPRMWREQGLM